MEKEILINITSEETKAAVLEDSELVEVYFERALDSRLAGNIYKGRVENILPGMQAAFVNIGLERNAFLHVEDVRRSPLHPELSEKRKNLPLQNLLLEGQEIIVQIVKEPLGTKGARVTTQITIPGRYTVFFPGINCLGVSRRIHKDKERERLKEIGEAIRKEGTGLIIRTAAEGVSKEDLQQDAYNLYQIWQQTKERASHYSAPTLLHREVDLVSWVLRDLFSEDVERLLINDTKTYKKALDLLDVIGPQLKPRLQLYQTDLWSKFALEQEVSRALRPKVWLASGGYLVFDETEALTVIDVNTGKYRGSKNFAETAFRTNMEATTEIARQLRLRNLGGIIIIDFIDMVTPEHKNEVISNLEKELERDKTQSFVLGLTQLGLVEMTRKKVRPSLSSVLERACPYCEGKGRVLSEETVSTKASQEIRELGLKTSSPALLVEAHPYVAALLIGSNGYHLQELEHDTDKQIIIKGMETLHIEEVHVRGLRDKEEIATLSAPVKSGEILEVRVEEPHSNNPEDGIARLHGYVIDVERGRPFVGEKVPVIITKVYRTYAKAKVLDIYNSEDNF